MLFKRRDKQKIHSRIRNIFWPSMGWKRTLNYFKHRVLRIPATTSSIAFGLAIGCSISFTPTLGFHILQALFICFIFKWNYFAGVIGTVFGNPWTFPFILTASYQVGKIIFVILGYEDFLLKEINVSLLQGIRDYPYKILLPTLLGGYFLAIVTLPLFYGAFYCAINKARYLKDKK